MAGFEKHREQLTALGAKVIAASIDPAEKARDYAVGLAWPTWTQIGYGVTREQADQLGSWWEERRQIIQPSEFILNAQSKVIGSSYSDGPLGRIEAADVVRLITFYEAQAKK